MNASFSEKQQKVFIKGHKNYEVTDPELGVFLESNLARFKNTLKLSTISLNKTRARLNEIKNEKYLKEEFVKEEEMKTLRILLKDHTETIDKLERAIKSYQYCLNKHRELSETTIVLVNPQGEEKRFHSIFDIEINVYLLTKGFKFKYLTQKKQWLQVETAIAVQTKKKTGKRPRKITL